MNDFGSFSRCDCPTTSSTRLSGGSGSSSAVFNSAVSGSSRVSTCTSRSPFSATGHRPAGELESILDALRDAAAGAGEMHLAPVRYRETRSVGMLVLSDDEDSAALLAGDVQERLERLGVYRREGRAWLPHLTVARWRERPRLRPEPPAVGTFVPSDAAAFLSRLHPGGARYEVLESVALGG
jgi:2'-5' RNA ligase